MAEYSGRDKRLAYLFEAVENVQVDDMTGASASTDGAHGLVPAPLAGDEDKYLKGDGTWAAVQAGAGALSGLSDVDLTTPTDGQALVYDGANSKWINGNVSGGGNTLVIQDASIYSTDEQQVGVWIDGKPLYQKTITFNETITGDIDKNISLTNPDFVFIAGGVAQNNDGVYMPIPYVHFATQYLAGIFIGANKTYIGFRIGNSQTLINPKITLRYTKTTDAAGSGGYKAYGLSPIIYSTEEREVGVWTDGKPLYQKTIDCGLVVNDTSSHDIAHGISDLEKSVCCEGVLIKSGDGEYFINAYRPSQTVGILVWRTGAYIRYINNWIGSNEYRLLVTLRYTKTTDTAGSGTWTTTGEYAHHYSTSEKVIGTWIDGKPLYEVVIDLPNAITLRQDTDTSVSDVSSYNVDSLISVNIKPDSKSTCGSLSYIYNNTLKVNLSQTWQVKTFIMQYTKTTD